MTDELAGHRRAVARAARAVLDGTGSYEAFLDVVADADYEDPLLEDLVDEINHLPRRSRLFGLGPRAYDEHVARLRRLADAADAG